MKSLYLFLLLLGMISCKKSAADQLKEFNKEEGIKYVQVGSTRNKEDVKVLILGNSITYHQPAPEIGWYGSNGMAASTKKQDFMHVLYRDISAKFPERNIVLRGYNIANHERDPKLLHKQSPVFTEIKKFHPDYLIIQAGDNIPSESISEFYSNISERLQDISLKKTIICYPFFATADHKKSVDRYFTKAEKADISTLHSNPVNSAKNDTTVTNKEKWNSEGIGLHPGNIGMKNIADVISARIN